MRKNVRVNNVALLHLAATLLCSAMRQLCPNSSLHYSQFTECYDQKDEIECKNFDANMGTFNPHARCYWYSTDANGTTGYCDSNSVYAQKCNHHSVQTVCGPDAPMSADDMKTFNDGFKGLSKRFSDIAKTTRDKRTEKAPPSAFDFMGYLAEELGNDWGELTRRLVENMEKLETWDWKAIATTLNGPSDAEGLEANMLSGLKWLRFYANLVADALEGV